MSLPIFMLEPTKLVLRVNDQPATRLGSGTFRYYKSSTKALEISIVRRIGFINY